MAFNFFPSLESFVSKTIALEVQTVFNNEGIYLAIDVAFMDAADLAMSGENTAFAGADLTPWWRSLQKF